MTLLAFIAPATARNVLLVLVGGCYLGYHLYHAWRWWRAEKKKVKVRGEEASVPLARNQAVADSEGTVGRGVPSAPQSSNIEAALSPDCSGQGVARPAIVTPPQPIQHANNQTSQQSNSLAPPADLSGEELYAQARAMPHQPIPDYEMDGEYLKLLTQSAAKDYPMAMAKLGEYAMRRGCNVEAYYWLWRAKRAGMGNLERTLLVVRNAWARGGFRRESMNEYECFTRMQGAVGYALLCIDSGHNAIVAKARLAECAPKFLLGS